MKPHKLTMKAFGPFAKETVVDFDSMGNSIYLISGDTGAGKTTIFDGIIYALYGTASGGARSNLGTEAFHSDYAKDGIRRDEMRVELEFSNANRRFTVARRMFWGKKGDSKTVSRESTLSENGNTLIHSKGKEATDEVTAKIIEILGLDADQFRRIIMLAQGEFQKFLTAKSDERGAILGKLYDNRRHLDFQMRLKAAKELLRNQDNALVEEAKAQINLFVFPGDAGKDVRDSVAIDHPSLLSTISQIIFQMNSELESLAESLRKEECSREQLMQQKIKGETQNNLLEDLASKKDELEKLDKKAGYFSELRRKVDLAMAAERVVPYEDAARKAQADWNTTLERIQDLETECGRLAIRLGELDARRVEVKEKNEPRITALQNRQLALHGILHFYGELKESVDNYNRIKVKSDAAADEKQRAEKNLSQAQSRQKELETELQRLASAGDSAVQIAERVLQDAEAKKAALKEIGEAVPKVLTLIEEESALAALLKQAQEDEISAEAEHHRLYTAFIRGQAGILAQELRNRLKTEDSAACPVCGTIHTPEDVPNFAGEHSDTPAAEAVDAAYNNWEAARKAKKAAEDNHSAKMSELQMKKSSLLEKSAELFQISDWETLVSGDVPAIALRASVEALSSAKIRHDRAIADRNAKESAMKEKEIVRQAVDKATHELEEATRKMHELDKELASAKTNVDNRQMQLAGFPEKKEDAEKEISSLEIQMNDLRNRIEEANTDYARCVEEQAANKGNLEGAGSERTSKAKAKKEAEDTFRAQLLKESFSHKEAFHDALSPDGIQPGRDSISKWIADKQEELEDYKKNRTGLQAAIKQLEESSAGMTYTDTAALATSIEQVSSTISGMKKKKEALTSHVGRNEAVQDELQRIQRKRARFNKVFAKLNPMVETADGRYAFSRYVLSGFFHRIVEQANIHLETMTDGEYCMVPKETGDGRSNIGLELKVLNTITNLERDTGSLSGGQLFEASLSLALGLSEVVQMESTSSIQIDSMFIDEGFGSLDGGKLDKAIEVLRHLSAGKRQIGIISHVARLDECLPKKIHVIAGERGSTVRIETDA